MSTKNDFFERASALVERLESLLPAEATPQIPDSVPVLRWRSRGGSSFEPVRNPGTIGLSDLQCIERQKIIIDRNTRQFLEQLPANNVLLWGPRGTGKSSLIKAVFNAHRASGLRLVEVPRESLTDLYRVCDAISGNTDRFLVYCDDLSFEPGDPSFNSLKASLDGAAGSLPDNVVIYATSNRRHLVPEYMQENRESQIVEGELHLNEAIEEKISLSERFGLWLSFHPFTQDQYLQIVDYWLGKLGAPDTDADATRAAALQWALERGSRSGRSAWQFARDWTGRHKLSKPL